jgi:hypothetical protein
MNVSAPMPPFPTAMSLLTNIYFNPIPATGSIWTLRVAHGRCIQHGRSSADLKGSSPVASGLRAANGTANAEVAKIIPLA